jgi:predicted glycosyltransferase involved in capsule biosynthesis
MISDVDVVLAPDYLATAVTAMKEDPVSFVVSPCLHLSEEVNDQLERFDRENRLPLETILPFGEKKTDGAYSPGMVLTYTRYFRDIGGLDEFYTHYGAEDMDLLKRFTYLGLKPRSIGENTYYLHQWHPRHAGMDPEVVESARRRNREYMLENNSIFRNAGGWGRGEVIWLNRKIVRRRPKRS